MKATTLLCAALLALGLTACPDGNKTTTGSTTKAATTKAAATGTGTAAAAADDYKDEDLPVPADFEDDAEKEVTEANYKAELDKEAKELGPEEGDKKD